MQLKMMSCVMPLKGGDPLNKVYRMMPALHTSLHNTIHRRGGKGVRRAGWFGRGGGKKGECAAVETYGCTYVVVCLVVVMCESV
jgi:hypothetical protein